MSTPLDSLGFVDAVASLPEQLADAHAAAAELDLGGLGREPAIDHVVVAGMGGSGVAGDILRAVGVTLPVPVITVKQHELPRFVGPGTLVFAVSYSGDTAETLAMADDAIAAGAPLVTVSSGGALAELARTHGLVHAPCPQGLQPRAALGALVAPLLVTLERVGLLPGALDELANAVVQLERRRAACNPAVSGAANPARELAREIGRTIPLVYGSGLLGGVAAYRFKTDMNENAKAPAFWSSFPELDHNEIAGWGQHGDVTRQVFTLVTLRHDFESGPSGARIAATIEILEEVFAHVLEVTAEGEGRLAQLLDLVYLGTWASTYLALDNDVDPGPVDAIARLKKGLAGR